MALSQENSGVPDSVELERRFRDDALRAKQLAAQLTIAHNPAPKDPKSERNAANPAHGVRIRLLRPAPAPFICDGDPGAAQLHNEFVSTLGKSGRRFGS